VFYYPVLACPLSQRADTPRSGAGSVRSEPWKRSPKPLAHSAKAQSSLELPQRWTDPAEPTQIRQAERDRSAASLGSDHQNPSRTARKPLLPRASSASAGPIPRSAPYAKRSGIGPQRALEANNKIPSAQRESPSFPRASSASAGPIPRSAKYAKRSGIGPQRALEANNKIPSRTARKLLLPRASSASAGPIPRSPPKHPTNNRPTTAPLNPRVLSGNSAPLIYGTREVAHSWTR
jgi:hypothetical protein